MNDARQRWLFRMVHSRRPLQEKMTLYNANQHETTAKAFSFPIYANGSRTIPARAAGQGMQDGLDLIDALVRHPETGRRLARKLCGFFINEIDGPDEHLINQLATVFRQNDYNMAPVMRVLLLSPQFNDPDNYFARYSWPAEFVARALKEVGYAGFSVDSALTPLLNMGQQLFEPPDVAGWDLSRRWETLG